MSWPTRLHRPLRHWLLLLKLKRARLRHRHRHGIPQALNCQPVLQIVCKHLQDFQHRQSCEYLQVSQHHLALQRRLCQQWLCLQRLPGILSCSACQLLLSCPPASRAPLLQVQGSPCLRLGMHRLGMHPLGMAAQGSPCLRLGMHRLGMHRLGMAAQCSPCLWLGMHRLGMHRLEHCLLRLDSPWPQQTGDGSSRRSLPLPCRTKVFATRRCLAQLPTWHPRCRHGEDLHANLCMIATWFAE